MLLPISVRGTMSRLDPEFYRLSPAIGLALSAGGAHLLAQIYALQPRTPVANGARGQSFDGAATVWRGSAVGNLARELYHRNHVDEPLRPTTNRSLAAAHLSPSLTAAVAGLAWSRPGASAVHASLRATMCSETGLSVSALARQTGVTIARFERLVEMVALADDEGEPLPQPGTALLLRHLWLRATTQRDIWTYLHALHGTHGVMLADPPHNHVRQP